MSRCGKMKDVFLESLYGELDSGREAGLMRHLDECRSCREEYEAMARTLVVMGAKKPADPGDEYWAGYYGRLERRIATEEVSEAPRRAPRRRPRAPYAIVPRWAFGAAGALALVAAGILIGRLTLPRVPGGFEPIASAASRGAAATPSVIPAAGLAERTTRYLDRSKVILLALVNFDGGTKDIAGLNLPRQKKMSQALVKEASGLKGDLKAAKERQLGRLVADLEMILVQIANLKSDYDLSSVEIIKAGAASKDILFQISLSEMRRADDADRSAAKSGPGAPAGKPASKI
jgi:hypothetical protein